MGHVFYKIDTPIGKEKRQYKPGGAIIQAEITPDFITTINTTTGCFGIINVPYFDIEELNTLTKNT